MATLLPLSAIVPTRNRSATLFRMLKSLSQQSDQPVEMIIIDASSNEETARICNGRVNGLETRLVYKRAQRVGAAVQRNEAVQFVTQGMLLFLDDDVLFEPDCLIRLWQSLGSDSALGGVNAMIINQRYSSPGLASRSLFRLLNGRSEASYAGRCIGPAFNLLPEDRDDLPEVVPVDWLNLGCTIYRREALPSPPFDSVFTGYSLMEDLTLSLKVGKDWKLANVRTARIFHDSQPGEHKESRMAVARMELVNRHYVMTQVLNRRRVADYFKLAMLEGFGIATSLTSAQEWLALPAVLVGKLQAAGAVLASRDPSTV